jgi:hypothetical protein
MNMTKIKKRRKIEVGDVFYQVIGENAKFSRQGSGSYIPNHTDLVAVGQVIHKRHKYGIIVALYEGVYQQNEINPFVIDSILNKKVILMFFTSTEGLIKGWTPFIGNHLVPLDMPYQTYIKLFEKTLVSYTGEHEKDSLSNEIDYADYDSSNKDSNFLFYEVIVTTGVITEEIRCANGLDTRWPIRASQYVPKMDAVVWKIFPEHYPKPK